MSKRKSTRHFEAHVRIYRHELECSAYRSLSPVARALLVEFRALYRGSDNRIYMSVREAMKRLGVGQKAAQKAISELLDRGWIRIIEKGSFHRKVKHATVYALENEAVDDRDGAITPKSYMRWQPP